MTTDEYTWPPRPCGHDDVVMRYYNGDANALHWQRRPTDAPPVLLNGALPRQCSACGGLHVGDFVAMLDGTVPGVAARLDEADWKYGYPHKFYVTVTGTGAARAHYKFYTCHLGDDGYGPGAFEHATGVVLASTGLLFEREAGTGRLVWTAGLRPLVRRDDIG